MLDAQGSDQKPVRLEYFGHVLTADPASRSVWPIEVARRSAEESFRSELSVERFAKEWQASASLLSEWRMTLRKPRTMANKPKAEDPRSLLAPMAGEPGSINAVTACAIPCILRLREP
jgi:transposase-like protein